MKRLLPVLVCCLARVAAAQMSPGAQSNAAPAYEPQNVNLKGDGRCLTVRPGDTVHYTLTIEGVADVRSVYADLRLRLGHSHDLTSGGLPVPDFRSLGGGGLATHDPGEGKMFHFAFKVPHEIYGGTYRGVQVNVRADVPAPPAYQRSYGLVGDGTPRTPKVEVTRHTREAVHAYCLNVLSNFGTVVEVRPEVTGFQPGPVHTPATPDTPATSPPASAQPLPQPSQQPVPQPR